MICRPSRTRREKREHDWRTCKDRDCDECQDLVDYGILMACDECGTPGHVDAHGSWELLRDGRVVCMACGEKLRAEGTPESEFGAPGQIDDGKVGAA